MMLKQLSNSEISQLIDEWLHNERDRKILKRRLIDGIIYERIAEEYGLSVTQVKNIVSNGRKELLRHL